MITLNDPNDIANLIMEVQKQGIKLKSLGIISDIYVRQPVLLVTPEMYDCIYSEIKKLCKYTEDKL